MSNLCRLALALLAALLLLSFHHPASLRADVLADVPLPTDAAQPVGVAIGSDGALWFTEARADAIGRLRPDGSLKEFSLPIADGFPYGIVGGPDGALWFTLENGNSIGRVTTEGAIALFPLPLPDRVPVGIAVGPDEALWFSEADVGAIGRLTVGGALTEFPLPAGSVPTAITLGPDGALWFADEGANAIGRLTTAGSVTRIPLPAANSLPSSITAGADSAIWFTEASNNTIGRIAMDDTLSEHAVPTQYSDPVGITAGPDGALWFTEIDGNKIGRVTPAGAFAEFPLRSAGGGPFGIVAGDNGALWFTEITGNGIGRANAAYATLSGPARAMVGQTVSYTLTLTNPTSLDEPVDPTLQFALPPGATNIVLSTSTLCEGALTSTAAGVSYTACPGFEVPAGGTVTAAIRLTFTQAAMPSFRASARPNNVLAQTRTAVAPLPDTPHTRSVTVGSIGCGATDPAGQITNLDHQSVTVRILPCPGAVFLGWSGGACAGTRVVPCTVFGGSEPVHANFSQPK